MRILSSIFAVFCALAMCACSTDVAAQKTAKRQKQLAMQSYTCYKMPLCDTFALCKKNGIKYVEICGGKLGGKYPNVGVGPGMKAEHLEYLKKLCKDNDIQLISYGVTNAGNEAGVRRILDFAKSLGMEFVSTESTAEMLPIWNKLCGEYGIKMCIHNHAKRDKNPEYKFWDYKWVGELIANYDNIGVCADNGAWECSGIKSDVAIRHLGKKIFTVHLKDQKEFGVHNSPAVIYGTGIVDVAGAMKALDDIGFNGYLIIEHGNDPIEKKQEIVSKDAAFILSH